MELIAQVIRNVPIKGKGSNLYSIVGKLAIGSDFTPTNFLDVRYTGTDEGCYLNVIAGSYGAIYVGSDYGSASTTKDCWLAFGTNFGGSGVSPAISWYIGLDDQASTPPLKIGYRSTAGWGAPGDGDLVTINTTGITLFVASVGIRNVAYVWPAADGGAGTQLQTDGSLTLSWAAAGSLREYKDIVGEVSPADALNAILHTKAYRFHYRPDAKVSTQDFETDYVGPVADEAPWAMHYKGGVINPVNTLGYMILGIQGLYDKIVELERRLT